MVYLYIDESGSMKKGAADKPYFIITLVRVFNPNELRKAVKRFVSKHYDELMEADQGKGKMFENGKFKELKGSCMGKRLKIEFAKYLCRNHYFEIYSIVIDNLKASHKLYENKARAFNYVLILALKYYFKHGYLPRDKYFLQIDERNVRTESKGMLREYANLELGLACDYAETVDVQYFDSCQNTCIQVADVFANIFFSEYMTGGYTELVDELIDGKYLRHQFRFPPNHGGKICSGC